MPLVGNNPQQDIVEYYDIYQTLGPILYLAAMGLILDYLHPFLLLLGYGLYFICQIALQHMQFPFWFIMDYYQLLIFCRESWIFGILRVQQKCSE
mgnify:CR=1 FL=1